MHSISSVSRLSRQTLSRPTPSVNAVVRRISLTRSSNDPVLDTDRSVSDVSARLCSASRCSLVASARSASRCTVKSTKAPRMAGSPFHTMRREFMSTDRIESVRAPEAQGVVLEPARLADGAQDDLPIVRVDVERGGGSADDVSVGHAEDFPAPMIDREDPVLDETRHDERNGTVVEQLPEDAGLGAFGRSGR
jgi:hypothetical protein